MLSSRAAAGANCWVRPRFGSVSNARRSALPSEKWRAANIVPAFPLSLSKGAKRVPLFFRLMERLIGIGANRMGL
jgi:hypothetical protein